MDPSELRDDLDSQLESLLHTVWQCERQWRLDDRFEVMLGRAHWSVGQ